MKLKKNDMNEFIDKIEKDSQTENKLRLPKGKGGVGQIRSLGLADTHYYIQNIKYKVLL